MTLARRYTDHRIETLTESIERAHRSIGTVRDRGYTGIRVLNWPEYGSGWHELTPTEWIDQRIEEIHEYARALRVHQRTRARLRSNA